MTYPAIAILCPASAEDAHAFSNSAIIQDLMILKCGEAFPSSPADHTRLTGSFLLRCLNATNALKKGFSGLFLITAPRLPCKRSPSPLSLTS